MGTPYLAARTIEALSFGHVRPAVSVPLLATLETIIGLGLLTGRFLRITILLLLGQMAGTVTPLVLFPRETFTQFPMAPTLEGQYIIKNIVPSDRSEERWQRAAANPFGTLP